MNQLPIDFTAQEPISYRDYLLTPFQVEETYRNVHRGNCGTYTATVWKVRCHGENWDGWIISSDHRNFEDAIAAAKAWLDWALTPSKSR